MKRLLLAGLAGTTALATGTPAEAHPDWDFTGGCGFAVVSDGTVSPATQWDGVIHVVAVAEDAVVGAPAPTASISVDCELRINGETPGTIVFSCSTPGTGFAACADELSYVAHPDDVVTLCDIVTVNGETHKVCHSPRPILVIPEPVDEILDEHVWPVVDEVTEQVVCPITQELDGGPLDGGPVLDIHPDGDVRLRADPVGTLVVDCDADV